MAMPHDHHHSHTHAQAHTHSHGEGVPHHAMAWTSEHAHSYEQPATKDLGDKVSQAMRNAYPFDADATCVMDFACGTGLISRGLAPYCKSIIGVDISQAMVDYYNEKVYNQVGGCLSACDCSLYVHQGIPREEMQAVCADLRGEESELGGQKFDVIVCSAAYHHFASIDDTTRILSFFLKPGGSLLVADFMRSAQAVSEDVPHNEGFTEADMQKAFVGAGLQAFDFEQVSKAKFHGQIVSVFLARGTKPEV